MKHCKYPKIKQEIHAQDAHAKEIVRQIHASSGLDRHHLWNDKHYHGWRTRALHLLCTFLLGKPHSFAERKWNPEHGWELTFRIEDEAKKLLGLEIDRRAVYAWLNVKSEPAPTVEESAA